MAFDQSRGFDRLPFSSADAGGARTASFVEKLSMMEFAAIALGGEIGELLNGVKKIRRRLALDGVEAMNAADLHSEIADIYSYLLKLSNILDRDLDIAYMEKHCINLNRFVNKERGLRQVVVIAGPPGSGKTSVVSALAKSLDKTGDTYIEDFSENPFLVDAISRGRSVYESQEWFLDQLTAFLERSSGGRGLVLIDQAPLAIPIVYGHDFHEAALLDKSQYLSHLKHYSMLHRQLDQIASAVTTIYLTADIDVLMTRCLTKGFVDRDWLSRIVDRFKIVEDLSDSFIDTTKLSPTEVVTKIERLMGSLNSRERGASTAAQDL